MVRTAGINVYYAKPMPKWMIDFLDNCDHINPPDMDLEFTDDCDHINPPDMDLEFTEDCES